MNSTRQKIKELLNSDFLKNFTKVFSGNLIGGVIYACSIPIIASLYSVESFGVFQLLVSIVSSFGPTALLRYEKLIITSKTDEEVSTAISLCVYILSSIAALLITILSLFHEPIFNYLKADHASNYYFLVVAALFFEAFVLIIVEFSLRKKLFAAYSIYRVMSLSLLGVLPIVFAVFEKTFTILLVSRIAAYVLSGMYLAYKSNFWSGFKFKGFNAVKNLAIDNYKFPVYNTPASFLNNFSMNIPVFLLSRYFGEATVGIYAMANRIIQMPLSVISSSVSSIYFRVAVEKNETPGELRKFYKTTFRNLFLVGLVPVIVLPFAPWLCKVLLGAKWEESGVFLQLLYPAILMSFISAPLSNTNIIIGKQEIGFYLALLSVFLRSASIYLFKDSFAVYALSSFSIASTAFYILFIATNYFLIPKKEKQ